MGAAVIKIGTGGSSAGGVPAISATLPVAATGHAAGNMLLIGCPLVFISSVSDSRANTYTVSSDDAVFAWATLSTSLLAGDTITVNFASSSIWSIDVLEAIGVASPVTVDATAAAAQGSSTSFTTPTITTTSTGDLVIALWRVVSGVTVPSYGSGWTPWTARNTSGGSIAGSLGEYQIQGAAGDIAGAASLGSARSGTQHIMAFKPEVVPRGKFKAWV